MTMLEKIARAIEKAEDDWDMIEPPSQMFLSMARSAVEEIKPVLQAIIAKLSSHEYASQTWVGEGYSKLDLIRDLQSILSGET